ncbi:M50 family metallopeptidase [bacterium]|nr:M50 family metallopeptidase [bacterium]
MEGNSLTTKNEKDLSNSYIIFALLAVIILHNIPMTHFLMYPFNLLATWIHEMGHGTMAELMGGDFKKLVINSDTSGYASYMYNPREMGTIGKVMIASAGYLGTSLFGALMLYFRKRERFTTAFSMILGIIMVLSLIFYIRSWTGWFFGVPFSLALIFIGLKKNSYTLFFYNFLAGQIALNAILDIKVLYSVNSMSMNGMSMKSDAAVVSDLLIFPSWFWASLWLLISVVLFGFTLLFPSEKKATEK